jgi:hypothetical protein
MKATIAETIYNPGVRLDDGTPEIIANVGDELTEEVYNTCFEAGLNTILVNLTPDKASEHQILNFTLGVPDPE